MSNNRENYEYDSEGNSYEEGDDYEGEEEDDYGRDEMEEDFMKTIQEFCVFMKSIFDDLEKNNKVEKGSYGKICLIEGLLLNSFTKARLIEHYINYVLPTKPLLKKRNTSFFLKNNNIYPNATEQDINFFKSLWTKKLLSKKEDGIIWDYFDSLIEIAEDWKEETGYVREKIYDENILDKSRKNKKNSNNK